MALGTIYAFEDHCEIITSPDDGVHIARAEAELRTSGFEPHHYVIMGEGKEAYRADLLVGSISVDLGADQVEALRQVISGQVFGHHN